MPHVWKKNGFEISTDQKRVNFDFVHQELTKSYWSPGISKEMVVKAAQNSIIFGVYRETDGTQVGYARLITDQTTFAYLADVFIAEDERGKSLGTWLNECIIAHPELQNLRRWMLATRDAHALYQKFGWKALESPQRLMERHFPNIYNRL